MGLGGKVGRVRLRVAIVKAWVPGKAGEIRLSFA